MAVVMEPEPFNCHMLFDSWQTAWSPEMKKWCCRHYKRGCQVLEAGAVSSTSQEAAADNPAMRTTTPYACHDGVWNRHSAWSAGKKAWCCLYKGLGCHGKQTMLMTTSAPRPYDCQAGLFSWANVWSYQKKQWCCVYGDTVVRIHLHDGLGCPVKAAPPEHPPNFQRRFEQAPGQSNLPAWHRALLAISEAASRPEVGFGFMLMLVVLGGLAVIRPYSVAWWTRSVPDRRHHSYVMMDVGPVSSAEEPLSGELAATEAEETPLVTRERSEVEMQPQGAALPARFS
jgi:hypothetical protein